MDEGKGEEQGTLGQVASRLLAMNGSPTRRVSQSALGRNGGGYSQEKVVGPSNNKKKQ